MYIARIYCRAKIPVSCWHPVNDVVILTCCYNIWHAVVIFDSVISSVSCCDINMVLWYTLYVVFAASWEYPPKSLARTLLTNRLKAVWGRGCMVFLEVRQSLSEEKLAFLCWCIFWVSHDWHPSHFWLNMFPSFFSLSCFLSLPPPCSSSPPPSLSLSHLFLI